MEGWRKVSLPLSLVPSGRVTLLRCWYTAQATTSHPWQHYSRLSLILLLRTKNKRMLFGAYEVVGKAPQATAEVLRETKCEVCVRWSVVWCAFFFIILGITVSRENTHRHRRGLYYQLWRLCRTKNGSSSGNGTYYQHHIYVHRRGGMSRRVEERRGAKNGVRLSSLSVRGGLCMIHEPQNIKHNHEPQNIKHNLLYFFPSCPYYLLIVRISCASSPLACSHLVFWIPPPRENQITKRKKKK